ncbi:lytic transglycosylase domain-containing protein [Microvirga splendida]|uniref:Lytic transglycosylase domain-containing protein n=1 Tax=Microvirga splendida TaxID=2795727 RepID=A0ABS0Y383_9HYPH|nr:lytic transglycosylase domain-containing protein [Microvirga splendida]MBJ6126752.1 lytic transglycosylase domain-containing protein [Microvirga splendida]
MTWQHFLRTLAIACLGATALIVASQARAGGGDNAPISPDQAEQFLDAAAAEAAAFAEEEAAAASAEEEPEPDAKAAGKKKPEAVASKPAKPQAGKAEAARPEKAVAATAVPEEADQETASLPASPVGAGSKARMPDAARAVALKPLIARYASENGLPYELADAVVRLESRYNAGARNGPHMGLTQINVRTAQSLGYKGDAAGLLDAETNLRYGLKYLATAYRLAGGDTCGTILRYQFGHRTQTMTAASRAYCAKVKVITAAAD